MVNNTTVMLSCPTRYRPTKVTIRLVFLLHSGMTTAPPAKM